MRLALLEILECPFCGSPLSLAEAASTRRTEQELIDGILGCGCCAFPVIDGIPILRADALASDVLAALGRGERTQALALALGTDPARIVDFAPPIRRSYRDYAALLFGDGQDQYFAYRFSDPTFVASEAVVRAVSRVGPSGRALDVAGGCGHLTRVLAQRARELGAPPPLLADLDVRNAWLARHIVVPQADVLCCDANLPLPLGTDTCALAVCSDAVHYVWHRRSLVQELSRVTGARGTVVLTHAHNASVWNVSAGMPLTPAGYLRLVAGRPHRIYGDRQLRTAALRDGVVDLSTRLTADDVAAEPSVTVIASGNPDVFRSIAVDLPAIEGELRVNPLYERERVGTKVVLRLTMPSTAYADEFGECREYLPESVEVDAGDLDDLAALCRRRPELMRQRVVLDVPRGYL